MKKSVVLATTGAMILGVGLLFPTFVLADDTESTFVQTLAEKLGISKTEVDSVLEEIREEHHAEREAEREAVISGTLEDGTLTERQGEVLAAMHEIREQRRESEDFVPGEGRKNRCVMREGMLEELNDSGLDVTEDELDEIHEVMQDLGMGGGREGMRMGGGMGRGMGR